MRAATPRVLENADTAAGGGEQRAVGISARYPTALFVGRGAEVRNLLDLKKRSRVLTLAGAGGIGKSHLVRQFANRLASGAADAVYLVDIDEIEPDRSLWDAIASTLGLAGRGPDQLIEHLASRDVVLVVDNCDSRLGETAQVSADLLHNCGALHVLVTSREPVGVDGELVWAVPPLAMPLGDSPDLDEAKASDAVRLFVACVLAHQPEFDLTEQNARDVFQICRSARGMPLLIQALAASVASDGLGYVAEHHGATYLLDVESPDQPLLRHRSLRDSLDWDYALLSPFERALLRRLTVFAGGWTLEAAEAVCADGQLPVADVGGCLSRLTARSLVLVDHGTDPPLYAMHDLVHAYAGGVSRSSAFESAVWLRHAEYLISLGMRVHPARLDGNVAAELERQHDNLVAALVWAQQRPSPDVALGLGAVGYLLWYRRSQFAEGRVWLSRVLEAQVPADKAGLQACAAFMAAHLALLEGDGEAARQLADRALATYTRLDEPVGQALALYLQSLIALAGGDASQAALLVDSSEAALRTVCASDDVKRMLELAVPIAHSLIALEQNDIRSAAQQVSQAGALARTREDRFWLPRALHAQALLAMRRRQHTVGRWLIERSMAIQSTEADMDGLVDSLCALGDLELNVGADRAGATVFKEAFDLATRSGLILGQLRALEGLACASAVADPRAAMRLAAACESLRMRTGARALPRQRRRLLQYLRRGLGRPVSGGLLSAQAAARSWTWAEAARVVRELSQPERDEQHASPDILTPREREVTGLLTQGLSNQQIAGRLSISVGTARAHIEHILVKLGFHSRAQVALWALRAPRLPG